MKYYFFWLSLILTVVLCISLLQKDDIKIPQKEVIVILKINS